MSTAKTGSIVKVHYTGRLKSGEVFDSSIDTEPLEFEIGLGMVVPGFENGIVGMTVGDTKVIDIPSAEAYGEVRDDLVLVVPKAEFPPEIDPEIGEQLQIPQEEGNPVIVTVVKKDDEEITLDANHELAGKDLVFEVELIGIN
ncbi:MAG: FKBP-type peptidyl-prolyl cis-trans isomerase [Melioribacteraceae bacterium]|nr:FKBP-type peptidyl-prolyl cis-trans isomerase [Melioribacteraceae bacterium]